VLPFNSFFLRSEEVDASAKRTLSDAAIALRGGTLDILAKSLEGLEHPVVSLNDHIASRSCSAVSVPVWRESMCERD